VPEGALFHVGSWKRSDGRVLKVMRMFHPEDGPLLFEQRMDQLIECEITEVKPMTIPSASIFYQEYKYGDPSV
jgi:hypothetical protein